MSDQFTTVRFRNQDLLCLEQDDEIWVAMRPVVEGMGLWWNTQYRKLIATRDRFCVVIMTTQIPGDDQPREHLFIPLGRVFGWLMTISPNKVSPEIRADVVAYQQECDRVLAKHFAHELHEAHEQRLEIWRHHWKVTGALREGWFKRYPHWEQILHDDLHKVPRAETAARLGYRSVDTITRNRRRIFEAGLVH
jgi:hypothetical protein